MNGRCEKWQLICGRYASEFSCKFEHDPFHQSGDGRFVFVLDRPTKKENGFGFPAVGETGDNLCRLLGLLQERCWTDGLCRFDVGIVDVNDENGRRRDKKRVLDEIGTSDNVIVCGFEARKVIQKLKENLKESAIICCPHLSVRGLMAGVPDIDWRSTINEALRFVAGFLIQCITSGEKRYFDICEFEKYCTESASRPTTVA